MSPLCVSTQLQMSTEAVDTTAADIEVIYYLYDNRDDAEVKAHV